MVRAVVVAEDARFFYHNGFDFEAFKEVMKYNLSKRQFVFGGSTVSQQTVKNLFLSQSRNPLRKWHELVITLSMERKLSKQRIMELYLNIAEFGRGIYGVGATSQFYWGVSASKLSDQQAMELAATLPSPVKHNPATRTKSFNSRVKKVSRYF
jgi:monofunctional biosynthetic peptidoglycan transglycosylase